MFCPQALTLPDIARAEYRVTVRNGDQPPASNLVWTRVIDTVQFGPGGGDFSYVGPCDADYPTNLVELELLGLWVSYDGGATLQQLDDTEFRNPAPEGSPVSMSFNCVENADTLVEFNLAIMRPARQGFFDIAVNFDDIFCSAKVDCSYPDKPIKLLHNPATGERDTTMVVAFACTTGQDDAGAAQQTWMYLSDAIITCADGSTYTLRPDLGPGNAGPVPDLVFQHGVYLGTELLADLDKCYWNMAIGIELAELAERDDCTLSIRGTASETLWPYGSSPDNTMWPYVNFNVNFREAAGLLECDQAQNPMDGPGSGVTTAYTDFVPEQFRYAMDCGTGTSTDVGSVRCVGNIPGLTGTSGAIAVVRAPENAVTVEVGSARSQTYSLPPEARLGTLCVPDPCCD